MLKGLSTVIIRYRIPVILAVLLSEFISFFLFRSILFGFIECDFYDRDQGHSQVAHFFKQSMQCRLIRYWAGQKRIAIFFQGDAQALKPFYPLGPQVAFNPDLIRNGLAWIDIGIFYWTLLSSSGAFLFRKVVIRFC
jgi:hypothetical protein